MGDVVHTLPAVTDAVAAVPDLRIDWVVEKAFADIPRMHPGVADVLPIEFRRWRRRPMAHRADFSAFRQDLRRREYDLVLDAQGLFKSTLIASLARGPVTGFDRSSARETLAALAYRRGIAVRRDLHAIERQRTLFAGALGYRAPRGAIDYGLKRATGSGRKILLLHGTTWPTKHWPEAYWARLVEMVRADGYEPLIPAGNDAERHRAVEMLGAGSGQVLDGLGLEDLAGRMSDCAGAVSVDTGLGHLSAALDLPMVSLFGPTNPVLTRPIGQRQTVLNAQGLSCIPCMKRDCLFAAGTAPWPPCLAQLEPARVWQALREQIE